MAQVCVSVDNGQSEWILLELQGAIEAEGDILENLELGELHFKNVGVHEAMVRIPPHDSFVFKGSPFLNIGHHQLVGKKVELKKPLAVLSMAVPSSDDPAGKKMISVWAAREFYSTDTFANATRHGVLLGGKHL
jgi:hypothetical protein